MYGYVVTMLNIGKTLIPCVRVLGFIHVQDMNDHIVDNLSFSIHSGVEGSGFGELSTFLPWQYSRPSPGLFPLPIYQFESPFMPSWQYMISSSDLSSSSLLIFLPVSGSQM
jgi:hypothetical protein